VRHNNIYGDATLGICTSLLVQGLLGEQRNLVRNTLLEVRLVRLMKKTPLRLLLRLRRRRL